MSRSPRARTLKDGRRVIEDRAGHLWPVTGLWCAACGMPLHRALVTVGVHPCCLVPVDRRPT